MGVRILIGHEQGDMGISTAKAVLFDSVTGWAFGPVIGEDEKDGTSAEDMAELFLAWLRENDHGDPRQMPQGELEEQYNRWRSVTESLATAD